MNEYNTIQAVFEKDFIEFLEKLGVKQKVIEGRARCAFCNGKIHIDNIAVVFPKDNEIAFACIKTKCFGQVGVNVEDKF
ncbi:MAG: hypothetical protein SCJ94_06760 [Bacillota bacterium]|nr:hypothetical protein [Bacillota bacterium]